MSLPHSKTIAKKKTYKKLPYNVLSVMIASHNRTLTGTDQHIPNSGLLREIREIWKTLSKEQMKVLQKMTDSVNSAPEPEHYTQEEALEKYALLFPVASKDADSATGSEA